MFFLKSLTDMHTISKRGISKIYDCITFVHLYPILGLERTKINMAK